MILSDDDAQINSKPLRKRNSEFHFNAVLLLEDSNPIS
jgi:hypothetical protein